MKGWLDNFGKADNANESNVSLPEGFVGLAYDTKGRNYSPAWGGQFAMGGSLPGATGMMYARYQQGGLIPIAQNGVSEYMQNKMQEKKDATIAKEYDLPEVVVSAPIMTKYNDPDKLTGYPQYIPKSGDNTDIPGWDMAEFYKSWVSSPEYERRMKNTGYYEDVPGNAIYRKEGSTIRPQMGEWLSSARESRMGALESVQEPGFIQIEPSYYKGRPASRYTGLGIEIHPDHTKTPEMFETVLAHEIGHAIDNTTAFEDSLITSTMLPFSEFNKSFYTIDPVTGNYQPINQKDDIRRSQALHIRNDPQEFKSDLNALRYLMFDKGVYDIRKGKEFTKEDLERAKEKLKGNESLDRTIQAAGESGLIKLMNVIAKGKEDVTPIAMNGASMPGSVGFTYARVAGAAPSKGKYAKKTMASAQRGKNVKKDATDVATSNKIAGLQLLNDPRYQREQYLKSQPTLQTDLSNTDSTIENIVEVFEPTGLTSWDDVRRSYQQSGMSPQTKLEIFGAIPFLGKAKKFGNLIEETARLAKSQKGFADLLGKSMKLLPYIGRGSDAVQAIEQYTGAPFFPGPIRDAFNIQPNYPGLDSARMQYDRNVEAAKRMDNLSSSKMYEGMQLPEFVVEGKRQFQNGGEMRFYQNGLDWKPKSMQEGGQEDGKIYEGMELPEVVVEGKDERMREAMSQGMAKFYGHIGELMGAPQKEMMQLITGKEQTPSEAWGFQKPGGWLDSYSSFGKNFSNFTMDALADPLNAVGVGLADDIFKLSVKNVGKNLTENLGKGIGKRAISQAPSPQMMADNVAASATPNASTVTNQPQLPYTELDHPHMDLLQELKQKTIDRIDTPEGRRRLQYMINKNFGRDHKSWGKPVESWGEFFLHGLKSGELSGFKKLKPDDIIEEIRNLKFIKSNDPFIDADNAFASRRGGDGGYGPGSVAAMYMGENQIPGDIRRIFDHEMGHIFQRNRRPTNLDDKLSELELKKQPSLVPDSSLSEGQLEDVDFSKSNQQWGYGFYPARDYFLTGSGGMEKLPFAAEIRQSLLRRGKIKNYYDEITPQMIEDHYDLYNKTGGNKSILRLYEIMEKTPKNFQILSETLNKLPAVTLPIAGGAAATISALQNQQPVQKQRNGGITKDNLGYWNPDNWGKPVEIGSNNITMEGVYEPLLGISDTGDTKLMQPGKNYKFKGKKVTEFPVAQTGKDTPAQQEVSRQDYLSKFNMYDNVLKSKNYTTPYYKDNNIDTSEGDMNCINGVCYMVSNIAGVKFDKGQTKDTYTGNATFADNAMDEGYYRSNPEKEGFGVGDIFQYARKKGNTFSRFPGEVDFKNENDLYPNHAVLIVNEFVKDGKKYFKVANNAGGDKVEIEDVSESELMNRYKKGYKTFDGGITYRYDPDKVTSIKKENQDKINVLKGKNPYSGQYSKFDTSNLTFFNNKVDGLNVKNELAPDKNLQRYADVYKTVYSDLGKGSNMPIDSFNKLIMNQIGIAGQETKFGELASNPKDIVPDSLLPYARRAREIYDYNFGEEDNWKKDYWNKNADNVQKEFSSYQDFVKSLDSEDSDYSPYRTPRSIGEFQQKDLSERGNFYKYDLDSFEGQVKSSLALAVDNYHKLKAKYPDLSEDQIIDLTTLMHNAPGKALEPRFVNYYLKRNDVDYIDKVKGFAPKSFGKDQSKNEKIEWKTEKISPEEAKSIADYVRSLPKTKRNGGDVGINQLDAQPMKKLNQLLNFTNNPDKDNWLDKYN